MKSVYLVLLLTLFCVTLNTAHDLQVGNALGATLAYLENVKLSKIPLNTRTKNVFYSSPTNQNIRAITAVDLSKSKAKVTVTSGGVGSSFANVRIKSERGEGLNYQVQIFV